MAKEKKNIVGLGENVDFLTICRTCLRNSGEMKPLYVNCEATDCVVEKLMCCTFVEYSDSDRLPAQICIACIEEVTRSYKFALKCQESHDRLKNHLKKQLQPSKINHPLVKSKFPKIQLAQNRILTDREKAKLSERKQRLIKISQHFRDYERQKKLVRLKETNRNLLEYMKVQRNQNLWNRNGTKIDFDPIDSSQVTFDPFSLEIGQIQYSDIVEELSDRSPSLRNDLNLEHNPRFSANHQPITDSLNTPLNDFEIKTEEFEFEEHKMEDIKPLEFELNSTNLNVSNGQNENLEVINHSEELKLEISNLKTEEIDLASNSSNFSVNSSNLPSTSSKTVSRVLIDSTIESNSTNELSNLQNPASSSNPPDLSEDSANFPLRLKPIDELVADKVKQIEPTIKNPVKIVKHKIPITASSKLSNVIKKLSNSTKTTKLKLLVKSTDLKNESVLVEKLSKKLSNPKFTKKLIVKQKETAKLVDTIDLIEDDDDGNNPNQNNGRESNIITDFYTNYNFGSLAEWDGTPKNV